MLGLINILVGRFVDRYMTIPVRMSNLHIVHNLHQLSEVVDRNSFQLDRVIGNQAFCNVRLRHSEHISKDWRVIYKLVSVNLEDRVLHLLCDL